MIQTDLNGLNCFRIDKINYLHENVHQGDRMHTFVCCLGEK